MARRAARRHFSGLISGIALALWVGLVCGSAFAQTVNSASDYQQGTPSGVVLTDKSGAPYNIVGSTVTSNQVACATTATAVFAADTTKASRIITNFSGADVYFGGASVTTGIGLKIKDGYGFDFSHLQGALYCIVASSTATIGKIEY